MTAIELYDGPSGAAYVQLTDMLINTKAEMKDCTPYQSAAVDHSTYNKMELVHMAAPSVLERGDDGVLHYTASGAQAVCVVPLNAKFEHGASLSLSDLADQAVLTGTALGSSGGANPKINKGVKLFLVSAPNVEQAEFLRALRANTIDGWQNFLATNPNSHTAHNSASAKTALATLFVAEGEASLQAYEKTQNSETPSYSDLKAAKGRADQAYKIWPDLPDYKKLDGEVRRDLTAITDKGSAQLDAYRNALKTNTSGYNNLLNAKKFSDILNGIDSFFPPAQSLLEGVTKDTNDFEGALRSAQTNLDGKQYDQAYGFVAPYRAFSDEEPRVAAVIDAAYMFHMTQGSNFGHSGNWQGSINEFRKASGEKDTPAVRDALKNAQDQKTKADDKNAAEKALAESKDYQTQKEWILAYEAFDHLTPDQRAIDADEIKAIEGNYIQAAAAEAKKLHALHNVFNGHKDKEERDKAYHYYDRAWQLSQDESWKDKRDSEGEDISAYLLSQGKALLAKPGGSGTELGWYYLEQAASYKVDTHDAVRDEETLRKQNHALRSVLWISIHFQDQTSGHYNPEFYHQVENAIITGLENSPIHPLAMLSTDVDKQGGLKPDFELNGDVLAHDANPNKANDSIQSDYTSGSEPQPNPEWTKLSRVLEAAKEDLAAANTAMTAATTHNNKKEKEEAQDSIDKAKKTIEDTQSQMDNGVKQNISVPVISKYFYTKRTQDIKCNIKLQISVNDIATTLPGSNLKPEPIVKFEEKPEVAFEEVSPYDTHGIKNSGTLTSDPQDVLSRAEDEAKAALTEQVNKIVEDLPERFFKYALAREEDDPSVAGEFYRRYLEITRDDKTVEKAVVRDQQREHARKFLSDTFDLPAKITINP